MQTFKTGSTSFYRTCSHLQRWRSNSLKHFKCSGCLIESGTGSTGASQYQVAFRFCRPDSTSTCSSTAVIFTPLAQTNLSKKKSDGTKKKASRNAKHGQSQLPFSATSTTKKRLHETQPFLGFSFGTARFNQHKAVFISPSNRKFGKNPPNWGRQAEKAESSSHSTAVPPT